MSYRNPAYYVVMAGLAVVLLWLVGSFFCYWTKMVSKRIAKQVLCLLGIAHRKPEIHLPDWSDEATCRLTGPFREYPLFGPIYYASAEGRTCKKCSAFKVERRIRLW